MRQNGHAVRVCYATTEDGWRLALHHRGQGKSRPKKPPVILLPGLGSNHRNVDFPIPRYSLARYLQGRGYDVWAVDLRGMGASYRTGLFNHFRYDWNFDDYVFQDLPVLYHYIKETTGHERFHWIGHSLGGMLALAALELLGNKAAASAVTVASAASAEDKPGFVKNLMKFDPLLKFLPLLPAKPLSRLIAPVVHYLAPFHDNFYFCVNNMREEVLKTGARTAVDNLPMGLILQLHTWYRENHFRAVNGRHFSYFNQLGKITAPVLMIAGSVDGLTPIHDIRVGFKKVRSRPKRLKIFGKDYGHKTEYSHIDLLLGKHAPDEVYPVISEWIDRFS